MSRSFIAGSIAGAAVGLVGLASVSLMGPPSGGAEDLAMQGSTASQEAIAAAPDQSVESATGTTADPASAATDTPEAAILDVPAGSEFSQPKSEVAAQVPNVEAPPSSLKTPAVPAPLEESSPTMTDLGTAEQPSGQTEAPTPMPESGAEPEAGVKIATAGAKSDAALARVSGAGQGGGLPPPASAPLSEPAPSIEATAEIAPVPDTSPKAAEVPTAETDPTGDASAAPDVIATADAPEGALTVPTPILPAPDDAATTTPKPAEDAAAKALPKVIELAPIAPQDDTANSEAVLPIPGLPRSVPGVKVNRLPSIGTKTTSETLPADAPALPAVAAPAAPDKPVGALTRFAARFDNPDAKPVLAILLLDIGVEAGGLDANALAALPFAATIALDPERKDVSQAAAAYRAAGSEVAILAGDQPLGATPADMEVAYQSYTQTLPEAVALIGTPTGDLQRNRLTAQHVVQLLGRDGRGFMTYTQGLNPGRQEAEKAGVPHASIDKLFGQAEDNSGTLGRELDRAAFDAGQRGARVIALPTTPEAITGLMAWAASPAAQAVVIAPVSAVMLGTAAN